ncbi:MAG: NAD(P)/FAD-dependent oxidoreductase, partial [Planctomycetota bacterium JB042]
FEPVEAVRALAETAVRRGARLLERSPVERLDDLAADAVVVAAGGWLPRLVPPPPETRVTLQHELFFRPRADDAPPMPPWSFDIATSGFYGFPPLADGRHKVALHRLGPPLDDPERKPAPADEEVREVAAFVTERFPWLDASRPTWRSCQYTTAGDGSFVFAPVADRERLYVAGCGGGHAFKFGPLLGEWAADLVEGKEIPDDLKGHAGPDRVV